jgi:hypothetical protein
VRDRKGEAVLTVDIVDNLIIALPVEQLIDLQASLRVVNQCIQDAHLQPSRVHGELSKCNSDQHRQEGERGERRRHTERILYNFIIFPKYY